MRPCPTPWAAAPLNLRLWIKVRRTCPQEVSPRPIPVMLVLQWMWVRLVFMSMIYLGPSYVDVVTCFWFLLLRRLRITILLMQVTRVERTLLSLLGRMPPLPLSMTAPPRCLATNNVFPRLKRLRLLAPN